MLKFHLTFFCFFFLEISLYAQTQRLLPTHNPKVLHVNRILQDILRNVDYEKKDSLRITIEVTRQYFTDIAKYIPEQQCIQIQEVVYDSCMRWGHDEKERDNLLAHFISHEFGHHLLHKEMLKEAGIEANARKSDDVSFHNDTITEAKADLKGNFYARLADYNPCRHTSFLIEKMYQRWIADSSQYYPHKNTRLHIAEKACQKSDSLATLFKIANSMLILQQYETAAVIYDYLAKPQHFPAFEMYYNAALARIGFAMSVKNENLYRFPLLLDTRSGLERDADTEADKKRALYLRQACNLLAIAEKKTDNVFTCQLYQGYIRYLQQPDANFAAQIPIKPAQLSPHILHLYRLLSAIGLSKTDSLQAQQLFEQAQSFYPQEANWNLNVLHHQKQDTLAAPGYHGILKKETIGGQKAANLADSSFRYKKLIVSDSLPYQKIWVHISNYPNYIAYCVQNPLAQQYMYGLQTLPNYSEKTQFQVGLSQSYTQVQQNYLSHFADNKGIQVEHQTLHQNYILQYGNSTFNGVLFEFDDKKILISWVLYELKKDY